MDADYQSETNKRKFKCEKCRKLLFTRREENEKLIEVKYEHPNNMSQSREESVDGLTGLSKLWFELDSGILKPFLVHDWENCIKEHIELTKKIKNTLNE